MNETVKPAKRFIRALRGEPVDRPPIWLMRQAGRYLPEYREVRAGAGSFLDLCYTPDLAAEVTLQPLRRFELDAAIIFSDILVIPDALEMDVRFEEGRGPVLAPIEETGCLQKLKPDGMIDRLDPVYRAIEKVATGLADDKALIGFCGAPWTIASYMIEGGSSRDFSKIRAMAIDSPGFLQALFDILENAICDHLIAQVEAGVEAVQLFDSWAGVLNEGDFERWSVGPLSRIARNFKASCPDIPLIAFPRMAGIRYRAFCDSEEIDALSLDQTVPAGWAAKELQPHKAVQGNLDPMILLQGGEAMAREAGRILDTLGRQPGFVFNLGHGVIKETPPDHVAALCRQVADWNADTA